YLAVTRVRLRLWRRTKLERVVRIIDIDDLMPAFADRIDEGYIYGDCQFSTDASSDTYLRNGVFACYRPLPADAPMPADQKELGEAQWRELHHYSHADTRRAYEAYTSYYLSTSGLSWRWIAARERLCGLAPQWPAVLRPAPGGGRMTKTAPRQTEMSSSRKRTHGLKRGGGPGLTPAAWRKQRLIWLLQRRRVV